MQLTDAARHHFGWDFTNYGQYWRASRGAEYFDMATLLRLGSALETGLRAVHRSRVATDQVGAVRSPPTGVFQQLVDPRRLIEVFQRDCGVRIDNFAEWRTMQELMVHRHLYAHRSGSVDDRYIDQLRTVTGQDVTRRLAELGYPDAEVLWFEPLHRLGDFIESARTFFRAVQAAVDH